MEAVGLSRDELMMSECRKVAYLAVNVTSKFLFLQEEFKAYADNLAKRSKVSRVEINRLFIKRYGCNYWLLESMRAHVNGLIEQILPKLNTRLDEAPEDPNRYALTASMMGKTVDEVKAANEKHAANTEKFQQIHKSIHALIDSVKASSLSVRQASGRVFSQRENDGTAPWVTWNSTDYFNTPEFETEVKAALAEPHAPAISLKYTTDAEVLSVHFKLQGGSLLQSQHAGLDTPTKELCPALGDYQARAAQFNKGVVLFCFIDQPLNDCMGMQTKDLSTSLALYHNHTVRTHDKIHQHRLNEVQNPTLFLKQELNSQTQYAKLQKDFGRIYPLKEALEVMAQIWFGGQDITIEASGPSRLIIEAYEGDLMMYGLEPINGPNLFVKRGNKVIISFWASIGVTPERPVVIAELGKPTFDF